MKQWNTQIKIPAVADSCFWEEYYKVLYTKITSHSKCRRTQSNYQTFRGTNNTTFKMVEKAIWIKQWPLTEDILQVLEQLVQEQLDAHHIKESTRYWNSPVMLK